MKKYSPYRVVYFPAMQCSHHHIGDPSYECMRERQDGWIRFGRKWNVIAHLEVGAGLHYYADYENLLPYNFQSCPHSGSSQVPLQQSSYVRMWPEGYLEASETPCRGEIQKLEAELHAIYASKSWRLAMLVRKMAAKLRKIGFVRLVGRKVLRVLRRMRGAFQPAIPIHGVTDTR